jgi:hypothetical protein
MLSNKNIFDDQQEIAFRNIKKYIPELIKYKAENEIKNLKHELPLPSSILQKLIDNKIISQT